MKEHPERDLQDVGSHRATLELLRSLFAAELLRPSKRLWIVSPWVSDIPLIDNTARQFSTLCPEWPAGHIRLSAVLLALMDRGAEVIVVTNEDAHNRELSERLRALVDPEVHRLRLIERKELHEKGILGDHFTLNGSMNFTYNGVFINDENLVYRCDPASVEERRLKLENRWREAL